MQELWNYSFSCNYLENSSDETLLKEFFDKMYLNGLKEIYMCEINHIFNIPSAFTRLFTSLEDIYVAITNNLFEGEFKVFYRNRDIHFNIFLKYYPKTSTESPILELEIKQYTYLNKVFEDLPTRKLKLRLKDYTR